MALRCIPLRVSWYKDEDGERCEIRKFLVTQIVGSNFPSHYPLIAVGRTNRNGEGFEQEYTDLPPPYVKRPTAKIESDETVITSAVDAQVNSGATVIKGETWQWDVRPPRITMPKALSKKYQDRQPVQEESDSDVVSTGELTHEEASRPKGEIKTITSPPNVYFAHLVGIFEELTRDGFFEGFEAVRARHRGQQTDRNGWPAWALIDEEVRQNIARPRRSWQVLDPGKKAVRGVVYRTVLILAIRFRGQQYYWLQIERKNPADGYTSPVLYNLGPDYHDILEYALEIIVDRKGRNLKATLSSRLKHYGIHVAAYRHDYNEERTAISMPSIIAFFENRLT